MSHHKIAATRISRNAAAGRRRTCKLDSELVALREQLHRRIASELHDSTCQHLIAASLGVMQVRSALADPVKAEEHCDHVDVSIERALKELRSLTYLLHPQHLFDEGLKTTIEGYAEEFALRTSLVVKTSISPAVDHLSRENQQSLLRIVQEALTNVYRHARASRVDITIGGRYREFQLEIHDDGQGIMADNRVCRLRPATFGTGLRIMQARLEEMEGRLEILTAPTAVRRGTTVRATFPCAFPIEPVDRRCALKKSG